MRWSVEPPHDPVLLGRPHRLEQLLPEHRVCRVLGHRRGLRLDLAVDDGTDRLVVSVHAERSVAERSLAERSVASGSAAAGSAAAETRIVDAWHAAGVGELVPAWATDADGGRIGLAAWVPGTPLDRLDDGSFVLGAWSAGETLAALHRSAARLDRTVAAPDIGRHAAGSPLVPTLGGATPSRVCVLDGVARWFDVAASALASPAVDVASFVGELRRRGRPETPPQLRRDLDVVSAAVDAFGAGYGVDVAALEPQSGSVNA